MMIVDRWTCPACRVTIAPDISDDAKLHVVLVAEQLEHGRRHAADRVRMLIPR